VSAALKMVQSYLSNGGLFNPELMPHDKVRDMVIACRDELEAKVQECERLIAAQSREGRHALRVEVERLREMLREARDFLSEHELNVFGAGATLFTKLCAALKEGKP